MSSSSKTSSRARAKKYLRRSVVGLLILANLAVLVLYLQLRSIETQLDETAETNTEVVEELDPVDTSPESRGALTFLVIGSDSREGLDDLTNFGDFGGERADVVMVLQVLPDDGRAQILSLPRDLWVDIPGRGKDRINAAFAYGGAPLMTQTVKQATGISINHYVEIDFVGFQALVDEVGGVTINFPNPARDLGSGLTVDAGTQLLDGEQALAYARSRKYQELRNGAWTSVEANDIGRTKRQQDLIFAILSAVARPSNLIETGQIVGAFAEHMTIDAALAESSIVGLAFDLRSIRPSAIEAMTLPTTGASIDGKSVVVRSDPAAEEMLTAFRAGQPIVAAEGPIRVEVLNGNGQAGSAAEWSEFLASAGFEISRIGDAERKDYEVTQVIVRSGDESLGDRVQSALEFGAVVPGDVTSLADVLVILGSDVG